MLDVDGEVVDYTKKSWLVSEVLHAKYNFKGIEKIIEVRIAPKLENYFQGHQIYIDGVMVGGDKNIRYTEPEKGKEDFIAILFKTLFNIGFLRICIPLGIYVIALETLDFKNEIVEHFIQQLLRVIPLLLVIRFLYVDKLLSRKIFGGTLDVNWKKIFFLSLTMFVNGVFVFIGFKHILIAMTKEFSFVLNVKILEMFAQVFSFSVIVYLIHLPLLFVYYYENIFEKGRSGKLDTRKKPVLEQGSDPGPEQSCHGGKGGDDESDSE